MKRRYSNNEGNTRRDDNNGSGVYGNNNAYGSTTTIDSTTNHDKNYNNIINSSSSSKNINYKPKKNNNRNNRRNSLQNTHASLLDEDDIFNCDDDDVESILRNEFSSPIVSPTPDCDNEKDDGNGNPTDNIGSLEAADAQSMIETAQSLIELPKQSNQTKRKKQKQTYQQKAVGPPSLSSKYDHNNVYQVRNGVPNSTDNRSVSYPGSRNRNVANPAQQQHNIKTEEVSMKHLQNQREKDSFDDLVIEEVYEDPDRYDGGSRNNGKAKKQRKVEAHPSKNKKLASKNKNGSGAGVGVGVATAARRMEFVNTYDSASAYNTIANADAKEAIQQIRNGNGNYTVANTNIVNQRTIIDSIKNNNINPITNNIIDNNDNLWIRKCGILEEELMVWKHQHRMIRQKYGSEKILRKKEEEDIKGTIESMSNIQGAIDTEKDQRIKSIQLQIEETKRARNQLDTFLKQQKQQIDNIKENCQNGLHHQDHNTAKSALPVTMRNDDGNTTSCAGSTKAKKKTNANKRNNEAEKILQKEIVQSRKKHFELFKTIQDYQQKIGMMEVRIKKKNG